MAKKKRSDPLTPGERLRVELDSLGLDQVAARKALGYSRQSINNIVNDRQKISRAMAAKLGRLTGHSPDYWLRNSFPRHRDSNTFSNPQAYGLLERFELQRAVSDGVISIDPFLEANLGAAFLALTLGQMESRRCKRRPVQRDEDCVIRPGDSAKVYITERIRFPRDYVGRISVTENMASGGLITSAGFYIPPAFTGPLVFWVQNVSDNDVSLSQGDIVANLEIIKV